MTEASTFSNAQEMLDSATIERLRGAADVAAKGEVIPRPRTSSFFQKRAHAAREALKRLEIDLAQQSVAHVPNDPDLLARRSALLELGSSSRMFRAAISAITENPRRLALLPRLILGPDQDEPRVAAAARAYLDAVNGVFSASTFRVFVQVLQAHEPLNLDELWSLGKFIQFTLLELILSEARTLLDSSDGAVAPSLIRHIKSLRSISHADWIYLIEPMIGLDEFLRQDPAKVFSHMDFETREFYRKRIAQVARRSDCTESKVAAAALELARQAGERPWGDPRMHQRRIHVGHYLIGDGFPQLAARIGFHPTVAWRIRAFVRSNGEDFFLSSIQILTVVFIAAALFPVLHMASGIVSLAAIVLLLFLPATQDAVDLTNGAVTALFDPEPLPKMDFSEGIPPEFATMIVVPTLLLNETQAQKLVNDLEVRYLANRDPNFKFALLTDLADSVSQPRDNDSHPLVEYAIRLIEELNAKYGTDGNGSFLLLHRHRIFNTRQGVWMGWERKRGKLLDLNQLLAGTFDAFPIKAGPIDSLKGIRYILTLDSDTQLPRGEAARMVCTMAHPLNQAVIDPKLRIVTTGFGILQPRIGVTVRSAARSRFAAIYSGQNGFDLYTRAISDAYQDLFGEGIFTGKGLYEVHTLHAVLDRRFPRNAILSHDLIEGAYGRAGLATDIELVDDYPSHYSAYMRRKHRWVRGDWQIAQWLFSRVPDESGRMGTNPISSISRWKIFDNLRRSLVDPFLLILFVAGWLGLPGGPLYWTIVPLLMLFFPTVVQFAFGLGRSIASDNKGQTGEVVSGFWRALLVALLHLAFLPHETMLCIDAIVRSMVRRFITGERLLEWETAAQSELQATSRTPVDHYLSSTPLLAIVLGALVCFFSAQPRAIFFAAPVLLLWALAKPLTTWLNRPPRDEHHLVSADREFLVAHALRIWRYFHEFSNERHNHLIPDNVMEEGLREAARVSPTNIGLLLNTRQAACELGFITVPEFAAATSCTLSSMARMEKFRGHLYNWYDTHTLHPLDASPFVSSVDSGNLAASLYTLQAGAESVAKKPLLDPELFDALIGFARLLRTEKQIPAALSREPMPESASDLTAWVMWLKAAQPALTESLSPTTDETADTWWIQETLHRVDALLALLQNYLPWTLPTFTPLRAIGQLVLDGNPAKLSCLEALSFAEGLQLALRKERPLLAADTELAHLAKQLEEMLPSAVQNLRSLVEQLRAIEQVANRMIKEMEFGFLVDPDRQILSIGFDMGKKVRHEACYDLLASEARIATFLAVARDDLRRQSWNKLGRDHTEAYGQFLLLSWSGTMFEYLMPSLWMRSYSDTLIGRTQQAVVQVQQAFGRFLGSPWGISESASSAKNDRGDYHYFAYGIPRISLWFEATAGPVISPYSTFLALAIDPKQALRNLRRMDSAKWIGRYGFYESADFTDGTQSPNLAREWMAHHHGMSLLAITNLLRDSILQHWFHTHPQIQATEMLLHEIPLSKGALKAQLKELGPMQERVEVRLNKNSKEIMAAL